MSKQLIKWYEEYPFRMQKKDVDIPLTSTNGEKSQSMLSPLTNLTLNVLTTSQTYNNFIICIPSITLRPIPLISYILADQTKKSVLIYSRNRYHYNNYYSMKVKYPRNWAYHKYPAGKIEKGAINIELYAPTKVKRAYRDAFKAYVPRLKQQFFDEKYPKILFNLSKNIRFTDSISNLNLYNEKFESTSDIKLGIRNIIFENIDHYIYNSYKFNIFSEWIEGFKDSSHRFIFHISNPNYKLLNEMKDLFNAYVFYYPFSFIRANEDLKVRNKAYFKNLSQSHEINILNTINLDNYELYTTVHQENIHIEKALKRGNIDQYFNRGMRLFEKINWKNVDKEIAIIIYQLKQLYFSAYKMFCIPNEFNVKFFDEELGWKFFHLNTYLKLARTIMLQKSKGSTVEILDGIITFLSKITSELSECRRFLEPKSYSRKGKNYALCEFLNANKEKKIIIGVQRGEKSLIYNKIDTFLSNSHVQVATLRQLARSIKDFSDYTLILAGHLLPSHFQILLKNWKEIRIFAYKGKNHYWIKNQIKLLNYIDISKEELSLRYLAEIFQKVMGEGNYSIQRDPLFKNFLEKKKKLVKKEEPDDKQSKEGETQLELLEEDVIITSTSITDMCRQIMKSNSKYRDLINEEKTKSVVKRYNKRANEKYFEKVEQFECIVVLENAMSDKNITTNLEIGKKYLYFNDLHDIKIESCFPHSLKKDIYLILFGEKEKLSISDFVKDVFGLEEDIDYKLIEKWQRRLEDYYLRNFNSYRQFHRKFVDFTPSIISSTQFNNWIKGNTNYTQDPMNLYYLGEVMEDEFFINNYKLIHKEGIRIQSFNQKLSKRIKKLVVKVLNGKILRADCSPDELLLLENIENCIYKIKDIKIKK